MSFFFQAEDGIRDYKVTGVQTCALPICIRRRDLAGQLDGPAKGRRRAEQGDLVGVHVAPLQLRLLVARLACDEQGRSEEHTSELQSPCNLVCRLLLEKKKKKTEKYMVSET